MGKDWLILKPVVTNDESKMTRIGHGDGGLGTVEYYERLSDMVQDIINAGLILVGGSVRYNAGATAGIVCMVSASDYGITAIKVAGGIRIVIPNNVSLYSFRARGDSSFLNGNELTVTIYDGKGIADGVYNTSNDNSYHPFIALVSRNQLFQSDPFVQRPHDASGIDIFHLPITTPGLCVSQLTGVSGDWEIMGLL